MEQPDLNSVLNCVCRLRNGFLCEVVAIETVDSIPKSVTIKMFTSEGGFVKKMFPVGAFVYHVAEIFETKWKAPVETEPVAVEVDDQKSKKS